MEFRLLVYLAQHLGRVVTKEELLENVWPDLCGRGTLSVHIRHLREKIEKDPNHPLLILTVWGTDTAWRTENAMIKKNGRYCFWFLAPFRCRLSVPAFSSGDAGNRYGFHQPHRKRDGRPVGTGTFLNRFLSYDYTVADLSGAILLKTSAAALKP